MESTILFDKVIFGPVKSRRLGLSLGVNLLPVDRKICNYNCVYCECGLTRKVEQGNSGLPEAEKVNLLLREHLKVAAAMDQLPDSITFAGNGEPTLHPDFSDIMDATVAARDEISPDSRIAVLSNATMAGKTEILLALKKADLNMLKLDTAIEMTFQKLNQPPPHFTIKNLVENLKKFEGNLIIQSLFVRGMAGGIHVDNTTFEEINAWLALINDLRPKEVMVYTIERNTPYKNLEKIPAKTLNNIALAVEELGIKATVYS